MTWSPNELKQFTQTCTSCGRRVRRWSGQGWQAENGMFVCFTGDLPTRADLEHRHTVDDQEQGQ